MDLRGLRGPDEAASIAVEKENSALRELEPRARPLLTVLLPFDLARIACEETLTPQSRPIPFIHLDQGAGDPEAQSTGLPGLSSADDLRHDIDARSRLSRQKRPLDILNQHFAIQIVEHRATVDRDFAGSAWVNPDLGDRPLAATRR